MSENGATILRNVFQFATVLNQASNSDVRKWDDVCLSNALDWADYCQELFECVKDKPLERELNSHLAQMTMLLQPVSCLYLTVDSLQHAKYLLVNTLMCNSQCSNHLNDKLKRVLVDQQGGDEILSQVQRQFSTLKAAEDLQTSLSRLSHGDAEMRGSNSEFQANFLVDHLMNVVSCAKKKDRFPSYCHTVCDMLMKTPQGNDLLVCILKRAADDVEADRNPWLQEMLGHMMSWLELGIRQDPSHCPLARAEVKHVATAVGAHPRLFHLYLDVLSVWADSCEPQLCEARGCLVWRSPDWPDSLTLIGHFQCLLTSVLASESDQSRRNQVVKLITDRVQKGQFTVWRHVATHLLHMLQHG